MWLITVGEAVAVTALLALALATILALPACAPRDAAPPPLGDPVGPPDVLLISVDTFRADRAGCMGHSGGLTPTLDRILRAGIQARDAYAPAPLTAVSHASMLTGLEPPSHGVRENGAFPLPASGFPTIAELLDGAGFRTAAFIAAMPLSGRLGFSRGFDLFDEELQLPEGRLSFYAERSADAVVAAVLAWLDGVSPRERWFVWAHFFDPHHPRTVPDELRELPAKDDYEREIRAMDAEIRRLRRGLEVWGGGRLPITVVVSDHGEAFGQHREASHGVLVHRETMHGLMGVAAPAGSDEAARLGHGLRLETARYSDIVPTLLDLVGAEIPDEIEGWSWLDASTRAEGAYGESYYAMAHYGWSPLLSWRDERWTYVSSPSPELFDRTVDPAELRNVVDAHPDVAARFAARIDAIAVDPATEDAAAVDAETREQLLALGYVSGSAPSIYRDKNPKELIDVVNLVTESTLMMARGDAKGALPQLQRAYRLDPENVSVLNSLGGCLRRLGDASTAAAYYRRAVDLNPKSAESWAQLASLAFARGDGERAFELVAEGRLHDPASVSLILTEGNLLDRTGRPDEALRRYREAVEASPVNPDPWLAMARLAEARGDATEVERLWRHITEEWPWHPEVRARAAAGGAGARNDSAAGR